MRPRRDGSRTGEHVGTERAPAGRPDAERADLTDRLLTLGAALAALAVAVQTIGYGVNALFYDTRLWHLDADIDGNAFTWASSVATFACAFTALVLAELGPSRWRCSVLAAVLAFFSLDDSLALHERIDDALGETSRMGTFLWPAIFFPLLVAAFLLLRELARPAEARVRRFMDVGLALLVAAVAGELATAVIDDVSLYRLEVALEEGAELAGWILVASALTALLCARLAPPGRAARG